MTSGYVAEEATAVAPAGEYAAETVNVRVEEHGPFGPVVHIDFMLSGEEETEGHQVSGIANKKLSANTELGRWVAALLGYMPAVPL